MILDTMAGGSLFPKIALNIIKESHSKITSLIPISQAKMTCSSSAMALTSIGSKGL